MFNLGDNINFLGIEFEGCMNWKLQVWCKCTAPYIWLSRAWEWGSSSTVSQSFRPYHWFLPIISGPWDLRPPMISVVCDIVSPVVLSSPYHMTHLTNQIISTSTTYQNPRNDFFQFFFNLKMRSHSFLKFTWSPYLFELGSENSADIKIYRYIAIWYSYILYPMKGDAERLDWSVGQIFKHIYNNILCIIYFPDLWWSVSIDFLSLCLTYQQYVSWSGVYVA